MNNSELIKTVERARRGERAAFELLYKEYFDRIYFFVLKNVSVREAAEDITQETFLQSMQSIDKLENNENYSSWLHSIAYHKCKDLFRDQKRSVYFETPEQEEQALESFSLNEPIMLPEDYAVNKELTAQIRGIINTMKPDMRSAVILYYYDNMSVSQVARSLGLKENAAKQKLFQARKKLKAGLEKFAKCGALCAVSLNDMFNKAIPADQAAAIRNASCSVSTASSLFGKIAGVSAAAALIISVPVGLSSAQKSDGSIFGGVNTSSYSVSQNDSRKSDSVSSAADDASVTDGASTSITDYNITNDTNEPKSSADNDYSLPDEKLPEDTPTPRENMSVEKMLSMNARELRELSANDFEVVSAAFAQSPLFGIKCAAFPEYVAVVDNLDLIEGEPSGPLEIAGKGEETGYKYILGDTIVQLDLYEGAYVGNGITVGMTYSQIKEALGGELYMQLQNDSLEYAAWAEVDGRLWGFHFDLTDEQKQILRERLDASVPEGQASWQDPGRADISDIDPVCDIAVYDRSRSITNMSVNTMLSMKTDELTELSDSDFEIVDAAYAQAALYGVKCAAFPEYVFVPDRDVEEYNGEPLRPLQKTYTDSNGTEWVVTLTDEIIQLDLYEGAYVGDGIRVGMSYNEIKNIVGGELDLRWTITSLGYAASAVVDGRNWLFHFDLTEEQEKTVGERAAENSTEFSLGYADISDMDPICDIAVHNITENDRENEEE